MAPLTWRSVDSPSFSGANDMWRIAASLMNSGFDAARRGVSDFQETTTQEQSARLMQDIIAAGDNPSAINAAVARGNAAFLSPQALQLANAQPGVLLEREGMGLRNTGEGIQNQIRGQSIRANDFNFDRSQIEAQRADQQYAMMPEALSAMTQLRTDIAAGGLAPEVIQQRQSDFMTRYGQTLGINDAAQVGSFLTGNLDFSKATLDNNVQRLQYAEGLDTMIRNQDAKGIAANVIGMANNNPDQAIRMIQNFGNIDPETKLATIQQIEALRPTMAAPSAADTLLNNSTLFPGAGGNRPALPDNYQPVIMQNNGKRNLPLNSNLNAALNSVLPNLGLTAVVTSGGQVTAEEAARGEGQRTGSVRHDLGGAADVQFQTTDGRTLSWENPQDVPLLQRAVSELKGQGLTGFGAAGDYMGATTTHIGYGTPAVWGAKGGRPYQALLDAYNGAQTTAASGNGPTVDRAAAVNAAPQYQAAMDAISNNQTYEAPIDPTRVQVENPDGTVSTERTFTTEIGGAWFNIPSMINGQELPEEQALAEFRRGTNPAVGVYQNKRDAENAAENRTNQIEEMVSQQIAANEGATTVAQAEQNETINQAVLPTLKQTTAAQEVASVQQAEDNFPKVNQNASAYVRDQQQRARNGAINNAIAELTSSTGGGFGSGVSDWMSGTWDYFTVTEAQGAANAKTRASANKAGDILAANADYFRANPSEIAIARQNPVQYAQQFGQTKSQRAFIAARDGASPSSGSNTPTSGTETQPVVEGEAPAQQRTRLLNDAETIDQMFSIVNNTGAMNQTNQQYQSITNAIQNRENSAESATETAARLTSDAGPLKSYKHSEVTTAIQKIRDELGVSPAIAGALLTETGNYSDGYLGGWLFGAGAGYDVREMDKVRNLWDSYQRTANAAGGIAALASSDMTRYQQQQVTSLQEQVTQAQQVLQQAIADPNTPPERVALYQQQLAQLPETVRARLNTIMASGGLTTNLGTRPTTD
jgi:hypothetical protein